MDSIDNAFKKHKPGYLIHLAFFKTNGNPWKKYKFKYRSKYYWNCKYKKVYERKIKFIYFSTAYVYPGTRGNYDENDTLNQSITMLGQNPVKQVLCFTKIH